ncbi:MAG: HAD-IC family P-type ATPase [candidate division Zixibacteria bacterium]|nr:HAD-IC family P-type ATPase [candidate division Zixibacteria bacterium]
MTTTPLPNPWSTSADDALSTLEVDRERGLSAQRVTELRHRHGDNRLQGAKRRSVWSLIIDQFKNLVILLLAAAAIVSFLIGQHVEAIAVVAAILINTVIGFVTELNATRSMDALRQMSERTATVIRNGDHEEIAANDIVLGDIVVVNAGDLIPADIRWIEANKLRVNESALTGESVPVDKSTDPVDDDAELAERTSMGFRGTAVTGGTGLGVTVAVGRQSEIGQIQEMVEEAEEEITPLEQRLNRLARRLIWLTIALAVVAGGVGVLRGEQIELMIKTAVALAVAAIPEGLPIVATVALARGMLQMSRRNAIVNRLASVETLGATSVIGSDKTGTLTENEMTARTYVLGDYDVIVDPGDGDDSVHLKANDHEASVDEGAPLYHAMRTGVLCNNASLSDDETDESRGIGDPMEVALLAIGRQLGFERDAMLEHLPEAREVAFDQETRMMATFNEENGSFRVSVKGSPEAVLDACTQVYSDQGEQRDLSDDERKEWEQRITELADEGLRVLALATKTVDRDDAEAYEDLTLIGCVGLLDPAREDVPDAIERCHQAGIRVVMMTGDQQGTARAIAHDIGLIDNAQTPVKLGSDIKPVDELADDDRNELLQVHVFARVSPRQKLTLIDLHQKAGSVVAMTGDGVNDAPALKEADIGVAMGQRGTEVAKQAADMVLQDDAFPTIVAAVRQGRAIFENIRKFVLFLLSGNMAEIVAVAAAASLNWPLPLLPLQILFLNLVLDVFPALALGVGEGDPHIMEKPPRPSDESTLTPSHWSAIVIYGIVMTLAILGALLAALHWLDFSPEHAVTVSFLTLSFSRLWHVFNMRDNASHWLMNEITRNRYVWGAVVLCAGLILAAVYVPVLADVLTLHHPGPSGWLLALGASVVPLIVGQLLKAVRVINV